MAGGWTWRKLPRTRIPLKALLGYRLRYFFLLFRNGFRAPTILFYPEYPSKKTLVFAICRHQGYNITTDLHRRCDLALAWENTTWRPEYPELRDTAAHVRVLNLACRDISKKHLGETFEQVFGYPLTVDPLHHQGECVQKDDRNASKTGKIVSAPLSGPVPGCSYQRLVNNILDDGRCEELRTLIIGGRIPLVAVRLKLIADRFRSQWDEVYLRETDEIFPAAEQENITRFCERSGLDWGELDILRDRDDGRIYIVDVNNTPWGPPSALPESARRAVVRRLAEVFARTWLEG